MWALSKPCNQAQAFETLKEFSLCGDNFLQVCKYPCRV